MEPTIRPSRSATQQIGLFDRKEAMIRGDVLLAAEDLRLYGEDMGILRLVGLSDDCLVHLCTLLRPQWVLLWTV